MKVVNNLFCRRCVSVCLWPLVRRFARGLWSLADTVITHSVCSLGAGDLCSSARSSPSLARRLVEASGLARSFVRVPYIRTRTSPSHSRAPRSLASLSRQRSAVSLSSADSLVSWHVSLDVPLVSSLVSLVLRLGPRPPSSRITSPLFRLAPIAGQPAFSFNETLVLKSNLLSTILYRVMIDTHGRRYIQAYEAIAHPVF